MSDQANLLIDVGNSSIKYAWYSYPNAIDDITVLRTSLQSLDVLVEQASTCWLCSVVNDETCEAIRLICKRLNVPFHQSCTQTQQFGVRNAYAKPSNMGVDRWMAILAASHLCDKGEQSNFIVIDAGTAITCDFVVANAHIGGWIAPGLSMARNTVVSNTKKVFDIYQELHILGIGTDTPECVAQGALAQLSGMIMQACAMMQSHCIKFDLYISGGDAPLLINVISKSVLAQQSAAQVRPTINYLENLVLIGLAKIAHETLAENG